MSGHVSSISPVCVQRREGVAPLTGSLAWPWPRPAKAARLPKGEELGWLQNCVQQLTGAVDMWKLLAVDCLKKMSNVICKIPFWLTEGEELGGLVKCCPDLYCLKESSWVSEKYHPKSDWLKDKSWRSAKYQKKHPEEDWVNGAHPVVWKALFHRSNFTLFFLFVFFGKKANVNEKRKKCIRNLGFGQDPPSFHPKFQ